YETRSRSPSFNVVRLQDSNPPPDDYKALEKINDYSELAVFRVSKTTDYAGLSALSVGALVRIGSACPPRFQQFCPGFVSRLPPRPNPSDGYPLGSR
ncbi:hypothetical protein ACWEOZ_44260, partial [Actinoplanes sp. NPDC004185]